jgi:hypothetical protein
VIIYSDNKLFWHYINLNKDNFGFNFFYDDEILELFSCDFNKSYSDQINKSFLIVENNLIKAFFLGIYMIDNKTNLRLYELPCTFFIDYKNISKNNIKTFIAEVRKILLKVNGFFFFRDYSSNNYLSPIILLLKNSFIKFKIGYSKLIDLGKEENQILDSMSQACRQNIKKTLNNQNIKIEIINNFNISPAIINYFKKMHLEVSGRSTRSDISWDIQYKLIMQNKGFIIKTEYKNEIISMSYFIDNEFICTYGSSVTKREYFNISVNHSVIWTAILEAKKRKCSYFHIGEEIINENYSLKEKSINSFKDLFGSEHKMFIEFNDIISIQ